MRQSQNLPTKAIFLLFCCSAVIGSIVDSRAMVYRDQNCPRDYRRPMIDLSDRVFIRNLGNQGNGYLYRAILVAVTSECGVKRVICKT